MASPSTLSGAPQTLPAPVACLPPGLLMSRPPPPALDVQRALDLRLRYSLALQQQQQHMAGLLPPQHPGILHPGALPPYDPRTAYLFHKDPRARFFHEEPKPSYSYIGLISMALLSSKEKKLILGDIYQWILDNYPYFRARGPGWRNSIRHNLSLNDCFIKSGRAANGKGHYWAIHPANIEDFKRGDFRRRRAQRKVRRAMGLDVPDEEDSPSPPPGTVTPLDWRQRMLQDPAHRPRYPSLPPADSSPPVSPSKTPTKRGFDVASLLAPDSEHEPNANESDFNDREEEEDEWIDVDSTGDDKLSDDTQVSNNKRKLDSETDDILNSPPLKNLNRDVNCENANCDNLNCETLDLSIKTHSDSEQVTEKQSSSDSLLTTSLPSVWPAHPGSNPSNPSPFWRPGAFPFPSPFLPWPASLPQSFTAALYANALSRTLPQPAASQNGGAAASPDTEEESTGKPEEDLDQTSIHDS